MTTESDLNAAAQVSVTEADSTGSAATALYSSAKTAGELKAKFDEYKSYAPPIPSKWTLESGAKWSEGALVNYAKANGKTWLREEGGSLIKSVASAYGYGGYIPDEIPTNEKEAAQALVDIGCAAVGEYTGINPKIAEVTVEALMDGKLDKNECESIGATAGSIAGAAICQMYGIPAPIGAFLGGEIGGFIGGEVADIFGFSKRAHEDWLRKQKALAARELASALDLCSQVREGYWVTFDAYVKATEQRWEDLEIKVGYKFDVRWFGRTATPNFMQYVGQQPSLYTNRLGPASCNVICQDGFTLKTTAGPYMAGASAADVMAMKSSCADHLAPLIASKLGISVAAAKAFAMGGRGPVDSCGIDCTADYGCLYPDMTPYTKYPSSIGALNSGQRVCAAYYALGFPWQPPIGPELLHSWGVVSTGNTNADFAAIAKAIQAHPGQYRDLTCLLPAATAKDIQSTKRHAQWLAWLNTMIGYEQQKISHLNSASVRLIGDLAKTAAMVKVQQQISDSSSNVRKSLTGTEGISTSRASSWVNNGALVAGLGWLAYNSRSR